VESKQEAASTDPVAAGDALPPSPSPIPVERTLPQQAYEESDGATGSDGDEDYDDDFHRDDDSVKSKASGRGKSRGKR